MAQLLRYSQVGSVGPNMQLAGRRLQPRHELSQKPISSELKLRPTGIDVLPGASSLNEHFHGLYALHITRPELTTAPIHILPG